MTAGWQGARRFMQSAHVIPLNDLREHESFSTCWCNPVEDDMEPNLWLHNALDGREDFETGKGKPS